MWKATMTNLPLILSNTTDMRDISWERVTKTMGWMIAMIGPIFSALFDHFMKADTLDKLFPYWSGLMAYLGVQTTGDMIIRAKSQYAAPTVPVPAAPKVDRESG